MPRSSQEREVDGRVRRGERNRELIIDAVLELVGEGELQPTAEQVAARAGVGTRTVFRHFADMEGLHTEISARLEQDVRPMFEDPLPEGPTRDRLRALVRRRAAVYERIAPYRHSGSLYRWHSEVLAERHVAMNRELRAELDHVIGGEARAPELREALDLVVSFEAWDRLRREQRLGPARAREVMETAAVALFDAAAKNRS